MIQLGIFAKTFVRPTLEEALDAVRGHGLDIVQFNLACAGLPSMPDTLEASVCDSIWRAFAQRGLRMAAVSGTFNMVHPDPQVRIAGLRRLAVLAEASSKLGTSIITLCTGTRDSNNLWRYHPANNDPDAWRDLLTSMCQAATIAEEAKVILAFEPETANVINTAAKAHALLRAVGSDRLAVVIDPANLVAPADAARMREILTEAFDLLGDRIVLAHAKDFRLQPASVDVVEHVAAGKGLLDYKLYLDQLEAIGFSGPLILHGLDEQEVAGSLKFLQGFLEHE